MQVHHGGHARQAVLRVVLRVVQAAADEPGPVRGGRHLLQGGGHVREGLRVGPLLPRLLRRHQAPARAAAPAGAARDVRVLLLLLLRLFFL